MHLPGPPSRRDRNRPTTGPSLRSAPLLCLLLLGLIGHVGELQAAGDVHGMLELSRAADAASLEPCDGAIAHGGETCHAVPVCAVGAPCATAAVPAADSAAQVAPGSDDVCSGLAAPPGGKPPQRSV